MDYSSYQQAIFAHFEAQAGHSAVISVAGSGKTTTAIEGISHITLDTSILMAAFNTTIKDEFQRKLAERKMPHVKTMTFNGLGWGVCLRNMQAKPELDADKTVNLLEFEILSSQHPDLNKLKMPVKRMVGLFKSFSILTVERAERQYDELFDYYNMECPDGVKEQDLKEICIKTFKASMNHTAHFDFDDQKFMPILMGWPIPTYDQVVVDEFQDTCPVEMNLLWKAAKGGQFCGIGDPDQAIYGFKGATPDAFDKFLQVSNAKQLPLSICYRCPINVIKEAQRIVPRIEWAPGAKDGVVDTVAESHFIENVRPGDFVLCRTTDELVSKAIHLIRKKMPAYVRGRDFGSQIDRLIQRITWRDSSVRYSKADTGTMPIDVFITMMMDYHLERADQLKALGRESEIVRLEDQINTIRALAEDSKTVGEMLATLKNIFVDAPIKGAVDLMTIHKSKGHQAKRVWALRPDLLPHPLASEREWMRKEENRLKYVLITRAEEDLFWVSRRSNING